MQYHIIDHHNKALYHRYDARQQGLFAKGVTLIHIDQHSDMAQPTGWIDTDREKDLDYIQSYIDTHTNVGNFIVPAQRSGLIGEIIQLRTEYGLLHFDYTALPQQFILDIDVDFREPAMSIQEEKKTKDITRALMQQATLITMATSPGFIDQTLAREIVKELGSVT